MEYIPVKNETHIPTHSKVIGNLRLKFLRTNKQKDRQADRQGKNYIHCTP